MMLGFQNTDDAILSYRWLLGFISSVTFLLSASL